MNPEPLQSAARRVASRLNRIRFRRGLVASGAWYWGLAVAGLLAAWWVGWDRGTLLAGVAGAAALWLVAVAAWSWLRSVSPLQALTHWDERAGHQDMFSSALEFAATPDAALPEGERRHIEVALGRLPEALSTLPQALPLPRWGGLWWLPVLAAGLAMLPRWQGGGEIVTVLDAAAVAAAAQEAEQIKQDAKDIKKIEEALTEEEKKELNQLQDLLGGAAEELGNAQDKTARDVLEALEARAKAAESLARKLNPLTDTWASEEMLREMSQHPDTADLAATVKDKSAGGASEQADKLAEALKDPNLKQETQARMALALERTMNKATAEDQEKPVGEHVGNADRKMQQKQALPAAGDFTQLANHFRRVEQREAAERKLRELSEKLREAGSQLAGSKMESMENVAQGQNAGQQGAGQQGMQGIQNQNFQIPANQPPAMAPTPGQGQNQAAGQQPGANAQMTPGMAAPVPGQQGAQGQQGGQQGMAAAQPGQQGPPGQAGQQGLGSLGQFSAPIPGMAPGAPAPQGSGLGQPAAAGAGAMASGAAGGNQAGTGSTGLGNDPTQATTAANTSKVAAQTTATGESTMRTVQGQAREEQATRSRQEVAADFIKVQEEALDEQALPLSRRAHVLKYFTVLRQRFEEKK